MHFVEHYVKDGPVLTVELDNSNMQIFASKLELFLQHSSLVNFKEGSVKPLKVNYGFKERVTTLSFRFDAFLYHKLNK